jgi:hypothetical protein
MSKLPNLGIGALEDISVDEDMPSSLREMLNSNSQPDFFLEESTPSGRAKQQPKPNGPIDFGHMHMQIVGQSER